MNLNLFDNAGRWTEPSPETLAALSEPERAAIGKIRDAAKLLEAANAAAEQNAIELKATQAEIAALEKNIPKVTFNDLAKQMARDTQARRGGL